VIVNARLAQDLFCGAGAQNSALFYSVPLRLVPDTSQSP